METKVYVNFDDATGYTWAETCKASMEKATLLKALADPASDFVMEIQGLNRARCHVYMMGIAKPTTVGSAGGTLLDGDETPLTGHVGDPPKAVYLYVDTTAARGKFGNFLCCCVRVCLPQS